jgi:replication factor C subunit 1
MPPKYHPPSSKLAIHVPYLRKTGLIDPSHATSDSLPRLPNDEQFPNFSIDAMSPGCLSGLAFAFTGILSANEDDDDAVRKTNADLMTSSPSKGDYYASRTMHDAGSIDEMSRETAMDVIKCLGGRVTTAVSGKTDYLIAGNVLEDGRGVEEGSKYRKCVELWEIWRDKHRAEYEIEAAATAAENDDDNDGDGDNDGGKEWGKGKRQPPPKKKKKTTTTKNGDPNSLVEVVRGIREFYGMVVYLSEWKRGGTSTAVVAAATETAAAFEIEGGNAVKTGPSSPSKSTAAPAPAPATAAATHVTAKAVVNPYARAHVANPYAQPVANPYARPTSSSSSTTAAISNPYAKKPPSSSSSSPRMPNDDTARNRQHPPPAKSNNNNNAPALHPGSGKELGINALWADRYAPSRSSEILGNSDSVVKLTKWLSSWERTFNGGPAAGKGLGGPNGPWKAALLSGPPGIGKEDFFPIFSLCCIIIFFRSTTMRLTSMHRIR